MLNYDPNQITMVFAGILVTGYAEGTFITAERNEDGYELSVGAGGDVTRVRNNNRSGRVTLTLQAESPSNDLLSAQAILDEALLAAGLGVLLVKDLNGTTVLEAEAAWIMKFANMENADTGGNREWIIECAELEMFVGGATI